MATYGDLINASLKLINVLAAGETPTAEESADALQVLIRMLDQWSGERLMILNITRTTFTITSGTASYAVAAGSVVNVVRPTVIQEVRFIDTTPSPDLEMPLTSLTDDEYAAIPMKAFTSPYPQAYWWNPTYPSAAIVFYPVPTATTLQGVLYAPANSALVPTLVMTASLPPGYARAIVKNLAIELCPTYGRAVPPEVQEQARNALSDIKRTNKRPALMSYESAALIQGGGRWTYDINSDGPP